MSIATLRCQTDIDIDAALAEYQDSLGVQLVQMREALAIVSQNAAVMESEFSGPLRSSLNAIFASADSSLDEFLDLAGIPAGGTRDDMERAFGDRYGLVIVNGRLILEGEVDLGPIRSLARLLGGLDGIYEKFPFLATTPISDDTGSSSFVPAPSFPARAVIVYTRYVTKTLPDTFPEVTFTDEETLGVDIPIADVISAGVSESEIRVNVFWMGPPSLSEDVRRSFRSFGLTNDQFVNAVSSTESDNFTVNTIVNPMDIPRVSVAFGDDADLVLERAIRPVSLFNDPSDAARVLRQFVSRSVPGSAGPSGVQDLSSPASAVMSVLDVSKTFNTDEFADGLGTQTDPENLPATQYAEGISKSIKTSLAVSSSMFSEFQSTISAPLNSMSSLLSAAGALLGDTSSDVMDCILGPAFSPSFAYGVPSVTTLGGGTPGIPGVTIASPLEAALSTIEDKIETALIFLDGVAGVTGSLQGTACTGSFLSGASGALSPDIPGLTTCASVREIDAGFSLPPFYSDSLGVAKLITDTLTSMTSTFRMNIRMMRIQMVSMRMHIRDTVFRRGPTGDTSIPGIPPVPSLPGIPDIPGVPSLPGATFPGQGCAAPEVSRLAALLKARSMEGFTEPPAAP